MLKEEKIEGGYKLYYHNGMYMGDVLMDEDGYYKYWPEHKSGYWDEGCLLDIAGYLHEKNKDWDESVNEFFR